MTATQKRMYDMLQAQNPNATQDEIVGLAAQFGFKIEIKEVSTGIDYDEAMTGNGDGYTARLIGSWDKLQNLYMENPTRFKEIVAIGKKRAPRKAKEAEPVLPGTEA